MKSLAGAAVVVPLAAVAVVAGGSGASASTSSTTVARHVASVRVATNAKLGKVLVDSHRRTLYLFEKDSGKRSACFGACATAWPPLRTSARPTVGRGLKASRIGTTKRSDGKPQVTYNGHPLYRFIGDKKARDANGQGVTAFGGRWFAVSPTGHRVSVPRSASNGGAG